VLLVAERGENRRLRYLAKPIASAGFIAVCLFGGGLGDPTHYVPWVLAGLILGAGGDVALMFPSDRAFMAGLVSFLLGHIAYVVACAQLLPPDQWLILHAIGPVLGAALITVYLWPHLGSMKVPVLLYVVTITVMVVAAIAVLLSETRTGGFNDERALLLCGGALAFFVSDISVARDRFIAHTFVNRAWGLPAYYAGQLLFAWSTIS
jgi:uncharacterized membrane protein YhhN